MVLAPYLYYSHLINMYGQANQPEGFDFPRYSELWISGVFMVGYIILSKVVTAVTRPIYSPLVKGQDDPTVHARYLKKCCDSTSKMVIYIIHFYWGYKTLYNTTWVPPFLLGTGTFESTITGMPFIQCPREIHLLCLSFLGMFCAFEVEHCQEMDRPDWNEMFAHHICSIALTFGMIFANNRQLGIVVAWQ